jgi:hypothetical protein
MAWPAGGILEVRVEYRANAQTCMNVLHYENQGPAIGLTVPEIVDDFLDSFGVAGNGRFPDEWAALISADALVFRTTAQAVYPTRYALQFREVAVVGTRPGALRAQNVQASIQKASDLAGRSRVGSLHIGALSVEDYAAGNITAAYELVLAGFVANFLSGPLVTVGLPNNSWHPVILNKEPIPNTDPVRFRIKGSTLITNYDVKSTLRVMRRRTTGLGI